jgi:CO dehydrogenase maturation factor
LRIGVIGKGGSGKTSTSGMLMFAAHSLGYDVWGLDADFNQHLPAIFGVDKEAVPALAAAKVNLAAHVTGRRTDIEPSAVNKFTTPTIESCLVRLSGRDRWLKHYRHGVDRGLHLLRVGDFLTASHGTGCYHGYTAAADILLNHLEMADNQLLVVDFTAGVDPLASPIFLKVDVLALVIEPTLKGVAVAGQWYEAIQGYPVNLQLVANKVAGPEDLSWLNRELARKAPPLGLSGALMHEPALLRLERGAAPSWTSFLTANREELIRLIEHFKQMPSQRQAQQECVRALERSYHSGTSRVAA